MAIAYLSIGSNLGDRLSLIQQAANLLKTDAGVEILATSSFYETEPWGGVSKNWFVNAAIKIRTNLSPVELLRVTQHIEATLGRCRDTELRWGERTLDIDILFYDDLVFHNEILAIPHSLLHKRAYVLVPMLEIASDMIHPVLQKTVIEMHEALDNPEDVFLYGTLAAQAELSDTGFDE